MYVGLSSCACAALRARLHFDDVLVVGLVGELLEVAGRVDEDARVVAGAHDVERGHRRAEVRRVEAAHEVLRQLRAREVHDDLVAELALVDLRARVRELHDHAAGTVGAAAEVDVANRADRGGRRRAAARWRAARAACRPRPPRRRRAERHDDVVAFEARLVRHEAIEVQHEARAVLGFGGEDRVEARRPSRRCGARAARAPCSADRRRCARDCRW